MPQEFIRHEEEPEPQGSGNRFGGPPKHVAAGVLDPPFPPKKPLRPIPPISRSTLIRLFAVVILVGFALVTLINSLESLLKLAIAYRPNSRLVGWSQWVDATPSVINLLFKGGVVSFPGWLPLELEFSRLCVFACCDCRRAESIRSEDGKFVSRDHRSGAVVLYVGNP